MTDGLRVLKYPLALGEAVIECRQLHRVLAVDFQDLDIVLWVEATPGVGERHHFVVVPTGAPVPEGLYRGTAQLAAPSGAFVVHVYQQTSEQLDADGNTIRRYLA